MKNNFQIECPVDFDELHPLIKYIAIQPKGQIIGFSLKPKFEYTPNIYGESFWEFDPNDECVIHLGDTDPRENAEECLWTRGQDSDYMQVVFARQEDRIINVFSTYKEAQKWVEENIDNLWQGGTIDIKAYMVKTSIEDIRKKLHQ